MGTRALEGNRCVIDKREILEAASSFGLSPHVVEKDYVLGWLLAGINEHEEIADAWAFKGGTCLKKCYFETYRFSEDLDFTLRDGAQIDETFLQETLAEVVEWVADQSGLAIPAEQIGIDIYTNPRGHISCQGKIGYRGPVSRTTGGWPKIKLDLTADETIVLPTVRREVFHPYSDRPEGRLFANCYAYEEAFAEKLRALAERTRPRDLYDVVNLYRHTDTRPSASALLEVLRQKCSFKELALPSLEALLPHREDLERMWHDMLAHQLPSLPPWTAFWEALPEIFNWIVGGAEMAPAIPAHIAYDTGETLVRSRVLPAAVLPQFRTTLEMIRFAAANRLSALT
jgi:predicted nucleotidyltransferase component of viral defense system